MLNKLNKEYYAKEIIDIVTDKHEDELAFDIRTKKPAMCSVIGCKNCLFGIGNEVCSEKRNKWANSEHIEPIKLTSTENIILKNLDNKLNYIARDWNEKLFLYSSEPYKQENIRKWMCSCGYSHYFPVEKLFKFIKWEDEEPYRIEDILNNCEVIDNGNLD